MLNLMIYMKAYGDIGRRGGGGGALDTNLQVSLKISTKLHIRCKELQCKITHKRHGVRGGWGGVGEGVGGGA